MKKIIKWKVLILTCGVCLLPILFGLIIWDRLPDTMAIHFNMNNNPDNFAKKEFAVFGLPFLMIFIQIFCSVVTDFNSYKHGETKKFETATKWIVPVIAVILQGLTFLYALGYNVDIRKGTGIVAGVVFLIMGKYLPELDYVKNYDIDTEKARKINRISGYGMVVMGILFILSSFLPPVATFVCILLLILYGIIITIYTIKMIKK